MKKTIDFLRFVAAFFLFLNASQAFSVSCIGLLSDNFSHIQTGTDTLNLFKNLVHKSPVVVGHRNPSFTEAYFTAVGLGVSKDVAFERIQSVFKEQSLYRDYDDARQSALFTAVAIGEKIGDVVDRLNSVRFLRPVTKEVLRAFYLAVAFGFERDGVISRLSSQATRRIQEEYVNAYYAGLSMGLDRSVVLERLRVAQISSFQVPKSLRLSYFYTLVLLGR